jgi:hypothetical protein
MYLDPINRTFTFDYSTYSLPCDRKLYLSRYRSLRKKVQHEALHAGKSIHIFVENFWQGMDFKLCLEKFLATATEEGSPLDVDPNSINKRGVRRLSEIMGAYYRKYDPMRSRWQVYQINGKPAVEIGFAFILGVVDGWTIIYCGRIDRIMLMDNEPTIVDTKSTTRFGATYWNMLRPNHQITGYTAAIKELINILIKRSAIDAVYIGDERKPDQNGNYRIPAATKAAGPDAISDWMLNAQFEHGPTTRSQNDVDEWWIEMLVEGDRMRKLFEHSNHEDWPKRTSQCNAFGECEFRDLCALTGINEQLVENLYEIHTWSPYD